MVIVSHRCQRFSSHHFVKSPLVSLVRGDFRDALLVEIFAPGRQMEARREQSEGVLIRNRLGLRSADLLDRRFHQVGNQAEVNTVVRGDGVGHQRWIGRERLQSILLRILGHDGGGNDEGNVVHGLLWKRPAAESSQKSA